jgi:hypothetical protein
MSRQETRRLSRNQVRLRTGQNGFRLIKRHTDLLKLVVALVEAGNHVLAEHGVIIADDPELDLNSHGHSEGSMADKIQPTCLPQRWPRYPTDFYALHHSTLRLDLSTPVSTRSKTHSILIPQPLKRTDWSYPVQSSSLISRQSRSRQGLLPSVL